MQFSIIHRFKCKLLQGCRCIGAKRAFQPSDGSCICQKGHVFFDEAQVESTEDSKLNCQKLIFERCSGTQVRPCSRTLGRKPLNETVRRSVVRVSGVVV